MVKRTILAVFLASVGVGLARAEMPLPTETLSVPAGTLLHCRANETLTTKLNFRGDPFAMSVAEPVMLNGRLAIPAGSTLAGHITLMERPGRIKGVGQMRLSIENLTLPDGRTFPVAATLMSAYGVDHVRVVGAEGLVKGPSSRAPDFEEIGAGGAGGTVLGLLFGHPVIGATVGLTATTVDRMRRRGKDLTIPVGTELNYQLTRDLAITRTGTRVAVARSLPRE
jgi:hypothetical protein